MPTIVDTLNSLADAVRAALAQWQILYDQTAAKAAEGAGKATTTINNFINRAPFTSLYIDPVNGVDDVTTPGRGSLAKPFKTIEYAMNQRDQSVVATFYLLGDVVIERSKFLFNTTSFKGIVRNASDPRGWVPLRRRLSFRSEDLDSPVDGVNRGIANFSLAGGYLTLDTLEVAMPTPAPGIIGAVCLFSSGASIGLQDCLVTVGSASADIRLIAPVSNRIVVTVNNTTFGPDMPGKIFNSITAGTNPNNNFIYSTNLTSA